MTTTTPETNLDERRAALSAQLAAARQAREAALERLAAGDGTAQGSLTAIRQHIVDLEHELDDLVGAQRHLDAQAAVVRAAVRREQCRDALETVTHALADREAAVARLDMLIDDLGATYAAFRDAGRRVDPAMRLAGRRVAVDVADALGGDAALDDAVAGRLDGAGLGGVMRAWGAFSEGFVRGKRLVDFVRRRHAAALTMAQALVADDQEEGRRR